MKARLILVILPLAIFITVAAIAAGTEKAPSKLRELDYLGGHWQCKGTAFAFGDQPKHAVVATPSTRAISSFFRLPKLTASRLPRETFLTSRALELSFTIPSRMRSATERRTMDTPAFPIPA